MLKTGRKHDVIVIGAGPAGLHCALRLHLGGRRILLIGDERFDAVADDRRRTSFTAADKGALNHAWQDAVDAEAARLPFLHATATAVTWKLPEYAVATEAGTFRALAVVLATGTDGRGGYRGPDVSALDLDFAPDGLVLTDEGFLTSNISLYAIGDVVSGLDKTVTSARGSAAAVVRELERRPRPARAA